jgi:4-diphosphocytidyl-2-C-methyl-D-erythritol kinase
MTSDVFAPAKINLTLHVTGQRGDGYHLLDSVVVFADLGDRLSFAPQDHLSLSVTGPFAAGVPSDHRNLVWKAAVQAGLEAAITLEKNLPHGAGIGGGSSDAAAVLRHAGAGQGASALGADVPVCLMPRAQRMRGIGDRLDVIADLPPLWAVLVNPDVHVPTPQVFNALTNKDNMPMPAVLSRFGTTRGLIDWLADMRNDLEPPAIMSAPKIATVLSAIAASDGVGLTRMSGSGSTCFGLFETAPAAQAAMRRLSAHRPDWWVRACSLS